MAIDTNLNIIREKIYKLGTAIMYSMSNEFSDLPNSIVKALKVDDEGQLWFACPRLLLCYYEKEQYFPARLHFYRKGIFYHLEVSGKATIVKEKYFKKFARNFLRKEKMVLIKMSMNSIEYTEPYQRKEKNRLELLLDKAYNWLLHHVSVSPQESKTFFPKKAGAM